MGSTNWTCRIAVSVEVDWGNARQQRAPTRPTSGCPSNGVPDDPPVAPGGSPGRGYGHRLPAAVTAPGAQTRSRSALELGRQRPHAHLRCRTRDPCKNSNDNPCIVQRHTRPAHRAFVGTEANCRRRRARAQLCDPGRRDGRPGSRSTTTARVGSPRLRLQQHDTCLSSIPTVGIRRRPDDRHLHDPSPRRPQANQTLRCDPDYAQGQEFSAVPIRLQALVRREHVANGRGGTPPRSSAPTAASGSRTPRCRPPRFDTNYVDDPGAASYRARYVDRPDRRRHRRRDRELRHINNNSCQQFDLQLRRQLRRGQFRADTTGCVSALFHECPVELGRHTRASSTCSSSRTRRARD